MKGVEIHETSEGGRRVGIVYSANRRRRREILGDLGETDPTLASDVTAIRYRRALPAAYRDYRSCVDAVRILGERRAAVRETKLAREDYVPPRAMLDAAREAADRAEAQQRDARAPLIYEAAVKRFIAARGASYARPRSIELRFSIMGRALNGRHLDELARRHVRQYVRDRTDRTGPFESWPHAVGLRPAQMDVVQLSALFGFLIEDEEREIENPCSRYRSRRSRTKAEVYRPKRKPVIPIDDQCLAIFDAATMGKDDRFARHLDGQPVRAFLKLCYFTGARPESEACALTHGAVTLSDPAVVDLSGNRRMGRIQFVDTKTPDGDRELPLHPDLEDDLKAVMLPRPTDPAAVEAWKALPIFRRRSRPGKNEAAKAWDKSSYQRAWAKILNRLQEKHPHLADMIVRDFRKVARTKMTNQGVPEPTIRWFMGHARNVSQTYCEISDSAAKAAVSALTLVQTVQRTVHRESAADTAQTGTDAKA